MFQEVKDFILLIPHYNNPGGLEKSIKSIHYPVHLFEVLIVDDGSTIDLINESELRKNTGNVAIELIYLPKNQGVLTALNTGLKYLHHRNDYKFIARLDCSDTCSVERFQLQVNFLKNNPTIALLGSYCKFEAKNSKNTYNYVVETEHGKIIKEMHYKCSFIHPAVMFKREVLDDIGYYPDNYPHAEDYAYFWEIACRYKVANLIEYLTIVEYSPENISSKNYKIQLQSRKKIVRNYGNSFLHKTLGLLQLQLKHYLPQVLLKRIKTFIKK